MPRNQVIGLLQQAIRNLVNLCVLRNRSEEVSHAFPARPTSHTVGPIAARYDDTAPIKYLSTCAAILCHRRKSTQNSLGGSLSIIVS